MARKGKSRDGLRDGRANNRPPEAFRFKPGQSGNPRGRPTKSATLREVVAEVLKERVKIREGERLLTMSNLHALVRGAVRRGLKGDPKHLRMLVTLAQIEAGEVPTDEFTGPIGAADAEILRDFLARASSSRARGDAPESLKERATPNQPLVPPTKGSK